MNFFLLKTSFFVLPILLVVALVNYRIDPAMLFGDEDNIEQAAKLLSKGNVIRGVESYNDRLFQVHYSLQASVPDILALGTSRIMMLNTKMADSTGTLAFFNAGILGATLEEVLGVYNLWDKRHDKKIKRVIIEVSLPWFNADFEEGLSRLESIRSSYEQMLAKISFGKMSVAHNIVDKKYWAVVSLSYFQSSINELMNGNSNKTELVLCDSSYCGMLKYSDGSVKYPDSWISEVPKAAVLSNYKQYWVKRISDQKIALFRKFLKYITSQDIEVVLFMNVFPPMNYSQVSKNIIVLNEINNIIQQIALSDPKISLKGSFDPKQYNLTDRDFYDQTHPKPYVYEKIMMENYH